MTKNKGKSALKVQKGIEQPSNINPEAGERFKHLKQSLKPLQEYVDGILAGEVGIMSKAITLVESSLPEHQKFAQEIIKACLPHSGNSIRIGITGVPGVGKSTFIEAFGKYLTSIGKKVAVLAIDPSSQRTKGSILGDKTRMEELANDENAFIRPSPSAGSIGGVARKTRETIILCEAAGFDVILVETVGVGQSETAVHSMVDFFLLLMLAGAGDELQGIKRGIMELADYVVINKADGENVQKAKLAKAEFENALHLYPPTESGWQPGVTLCSALQHDGIQDVWEIIMRHDFHCKKSEFFTKKRHEQTLRIMLDSLDERIKEKFYSNPEVKRILPQLKKDLLDNKISSYEAARLLFENLKL